MKDLLNATNDIASEYNQQHLYNDEDDRKED